MEIWKFKEEDEKEEGRRRCGWRRRRKRRRRRLRKRRGRRNRRRKRENGRRCCDACRICKVQELNDKTEILSGSLYLGRENWCGCCLQK